jgi:hypothetical protein
LAPPGRKDRRRPSGSLGPADLPAAIGSSVPAGATDTSAPSDQRRNSCPLDPWDAKQVPTCGWRSALLLKAQPADANLRSLFGFASGERASGPWIAIPKRQQLVSKKRVKARGTRARAKRVRAETYRCSAVIWEIQTNVSYRCEHSLRGAARRPQRPRDAGTAGGSCVGAKLADCRCSLEVISLSRLTG